MPGGICRTIGTLLRLDAETIALFMAFRPEAGCRLPHAALRSLRALATKRRQLVDALKRHSLHCKVRAKHGTASEFENLDNEFKNLLDRQIKELDQRIKTLLTSDAELAGAAAILLSVPGIGPVACATPIAEMPELGRMRGKRAIGGGTLQCVLCQAALVASRHNADLEAFANRLRGEGKPHKVVVTAVACKLPATANALCKSRQS